LLGFSDYRRRSIVFHFGAAQMRRPLRQREILSRARLTMLVQPQQPNEGFSPESRATGHHCIATDDQRALDRRTGADGMR
jgi:hypothetical protein